MPPKPAVAPSHLVRDLEALGRLLLQLRQKVLGFKHEASVKACRDCEKVVHDVEKILPKLEGGLPGLQLVKSQVVEGIAVTIQHGIGIWVFALLSPSDRFFQCQRSTMFP
jgi:hypothetical protein